ncbi:MAG: acetylglutamate kinase [Gammaproteobacteria bacterium]
MNPLTKPIIVIKLGGSVLDNTLYLQQLCTDILKIHQANYRIVIVHGGGKAISQALIHHNIDSYFINGLRVTSQAAINIIQQVLCKQLNPAIVRQLNTSGLPALGLNGADQQLLLCQAHSAQHGYVGDIQTINSELIHHLITHPSEFVPVIAPLGIDQQGMLFNVNADYVASAIAIAVNAQQLVYITDQNGIYDQQRRPIPEINLQQLSELQARAIISDGMLPKVDAIMMALHANIACVHIINGKQKYALSQQLLNHQTSGTLCHLHAKRSYA